MKHKKGQLCAREFSTNNKPSEAPLELEEGEKLMIKKTFIKEPIKEEPSQRRELFRIRWKIMGKVCRVIIDSGSIDKIFSEEAVSKLNLKRLPHANPYKVTWLNKGQHVLVGEQAWVEFTIGIYKDRVLCAILPMDAYYLLLGRPWKFNNQAI